jgi:hypothetical protein
MKTFLDNSRLYSAAMSRFIVVASDDSGLPSFSKGSAQYRMWRPAWRHKIS